MAQLLAESAGKPGIEDSFLALESLTAAYAGRLGNAREMSRKAEASAQRAQEKETVAEYEASAALTEALFGNTAEARKQAAMALGLSTARDNQYAAALALGFAGDTARAQALADDLARRFPEDTISEFNYLPTLRAQLAINRKDSNTAVETLRAAAPYELGDQAKPSSHSWLFIPSTCGGKHIWPRVKAPKPPPSSRKSSTIPESW